MKSSITWKPPGKNCGLCGEKDCNSFIISVNKCEKEYEECLYYENEQSKRQNQMDVSCYVGKDVLNNTYDFILKPIPGEKSARKIILPFRSDLVEKMDIKRGDIVMGRPMGAGCPIPHVLEVIEADQVTGVLYTWVVGPKYSRGNEVKDVKAYHMIGFEGIATNINNEPILGARATFLPGFCMMNLNHTGLINMVLKKNCGLHIRIEDIHILASKY